MPLRRRMACLEPAAAPPPPAFSVIPVVGDGKWIWTAPPQGETGYLEPRPYRLEVGIEIVGRGDAGPIKATTPLPVPCPEQKLEEEQIQTQGCEAEVRDVGADARQLLLVASEIAEGQVVSAVARYKLTLYKQYHNYQVSRVPRGPGCSRRGAQVVSVRQPRHPDPHAAGPQIAQRAARRQQTSVGPGPDVRRLDPRHIKPQVGPYTGVTAGW